ncbi:hypothetical protein N7486_007844 [Penicillium sp. IBT 16267x]|nr:hypothetical protein N7486_007844 [Penicillium sp. IBT 16267x]
MTTRSVYTATDGEKTWNWWSPLYKKHVGSGPGCERTATTATFGFTIYEDGAQSITMCPVSFSYSKRKYTLSAWRSGEKIIAEGTAMQKALSIPAIFMHELAHLVTDGVSLVADNVLDCAALALVALVVLVLLVLRSAARAADRVTGMP